MTTAPRQPLKPKAILTIGYREPGAMEQIQQLMDDDPTAMLIDIRFSPRSQNIAWNKSSFTKKWGGRYMWIKDLGNIHYSSPEKGIEILNPDEGIRQLFILHYTHSIILLCGCEEYESCHRKVIYNLLTEHIEMHTSNIPTTKDAGKAETSKEVLAACIQLPPTSQDEQESDPTEHPQTKPRKAKAKDPHVQELEEKVAELEAKLLLLNPEMQKTAHEKLKESDLTIRGLRHTIDNQERQITRLLAEQQQSQVIAPAEQRRQENIQKQKEIDRQAEIQSLLSTNTEQTHHIAKQYATIKELQEKLAAKEVLAACIQLPPSQEEQAAAQQIAQNALEQAERERQENSELRQRINKLERIAEGKHRQLQQARQQIKELANGTAKTVTLATYEQEQQRRRAAEQRADKMTQRLKQIRQSPFKVTERLLIDELQCMADNPNAKRDEEGYISICQETAARHLNISPSAVSRNLDGIQTQWTDAPAKYKKVPEKTRDGRIVPRLHIKPETTNLIAAAINANISETKIKQGGDRTICSRCGSVCVHRETIKKVNIVCDDCQHTILESEEKISISYPNASYTKEDAKRKQAERNLQPNIITIQNADCDEQNACNLQDEKITSYPPSVAEGDREGKAIAQGGELLYMIAGRDEEGHISMPQGDWQKKYMTLSRELTLKDCQEHLEGKEARGSRCQYPGDQARAICFDADDPENWGILQGAADRLTAAGIIVVLEESPAERGGHFWVLFRELVNASAARSYLYSIAPELQEIKEYWPALPGVKGNRVRLPGGYYYSKKGDVVIKGWCKLTNAMTQQSAEQGGIEAASLLLTAYNDASLIPPQPDPDKSPVPVVVESAKPEPARRPATRELTAQERKLGYKLPDVDEQWEQRKGNGKIMQTTRYFAIMPDYAARWFNERHSLDEIQPKERNGMALSPNGSERTASTGYYVGNDGQERYTDFSIHGKRSDGTNDTGDALELACRIWGKPKWQLLSETCKEISSKATAEMESAARAGQPLPAWLEEPCIITPAGRRRYAFLKNQLGKRIDTEIKEYVKEFVQLDEVKPLLVALGTMLEEQDGRAEQPGTDQVTDRSDPNVEAGYTEPAGGDPAAQVHNSKFEAEPSREEGAKRVDVKKNLGTCRAVEDYKSKKQCGSTRWLEVGEEGYVCAKCFSPISWSQR